MRSIAGSEAESCRPGGRSPRGTVTRTLVSHALVAYVLTASSVRTGQPSACPFSGAVGWGSRSTSATDGESSVRHLGRRAFYARNYARNRPRHARNHPPPADQRPPPDEGPTATTIARQHCGHQGSVRQGRRCHALRAHDSFAGWMSSLSLTVASDCGLGVAVRIEPFETPATAGGGSCLYSPTLICFSNACDCVEPAVFGSMNCRPHGKTLPKIDCAGRSTCASTVALWRHFSRGPPSHPIGGHSCAALALPSLGGSPAGEWRC